MRLKWLGAFVLLPVNLSRSSVIWISLAVCLLLCLFYLFGLSLSKIVTWAVTYWNSSSWCWPYWVFPPRKQKQMKRGEEGQGEGQKGGMSSGTLSSELLMCQLSYSHSLHLAGAVCLNFELCVSMSPSTCSGCVEVPSVILDNRTLSWVSRRNSVKACINTAWAIPYVRSLFLNRQFNFFSCRSSLWLKNIHPQVFLYKSVWSKAYSKVSIRYFSSAVMSTVS